MSGWGSPRFGCTIRLPVSQSCSRMYLSNPDESSIIGFIDQHLQGDHVTESEMGRRANVTLRGVESSQSGATRGRW